jgi:hypothetical protein
MSLFLRYFAAIVVAFAASMATALLVSVLIGSLRLTSDGFPVLSFVSAFLFNALVGLAGVFVGALCLPRANQVSGAAVLLAFGVSFEILFFMTLPGSHAGFPRGVLGTAPGGLLAVGLHYWRRKANQSLEPTASRLDV